MNVRLHPHARQRIKERGATTAEVITAVRHRRMSPAKFGRTRFVQRFPFGRFWKRRRYAFKEIEAIAAPQAKG